MKNVIVSMFLLANTIAFLIACSDEDDDEPVVKQFVLVHGSWQAAFVWDAVKAQLVTYRKM